MTATVYDTRMKNMATGSLALITGASGGLGAEFARQLAKRGCNLVLTARSAPEMERLADEIRSACGVEVTVEASDLSEPGAAERLVERLSLKKLDPDILVNNAGFGLNSPFVRHDPQRLRAMLQLNVVSFTELAQAYGRRMADRGTGRILLVGSLSAYQPNPFLAAYGASKAYVLSLGEALTVELAPAVTVTTLSPGLMDTGFNAAAGFETPKSMQRFAMAPAKVAAIGLDAMFAGKSGVIAGRMNKVLAFSSRLFSRHAAAKIAAGTARESQSVKT